MSTADTIGAEDWQGERGERWLRDMAGFESMLEPMGAALLAHAALQPGERVVDIGCGGGRTSRMAASAVGSTGHVCGVDIALPLIEEARRRAAGIGNLAFILADASSAPVPGAPFDRMISRLGVMFFADPAWAFAHLRELLVDGGRLDWAVWAAPEDNPWMSSARRIAARYLDLPAPNPLAPGPFALADAERLTRLLTDAGFSDIGITAWEGRLAVGGAATPAGAAAFACEAFSFSDAIADTAPDTRAAIRADLTAFYGSFINEGMLAAPAKAWLVTATA